MWLSGRFYEQTGGAIGGQALEDGIRILEARAVNEGPQCERFTRIGYDGKMYLDLGDPTWRAAEVAAAAGASLAGFLIAGADGALRAAGSSGGDARCCSPGAAWAGSLISASGSERMIRAVAWSLAAAIKASLLSHNVKQ